jgi:predicted Zn finger-like uncharacterized protein
MEIRCGSCKKLFRVSDDKITGKGIKFACTRCGDYVKITKEAFENHILSQSAVTAFNMFEPQAEPPAPVIPGPEAPKVEGPAKGLEAALEEKAFTEGPGVEPAGPDFSTSTDRDFLQEREEPAPSEPSPYDEQPPHSEPHPATESEPPPQPAHEELRPEPLNEPFIEDQSEPLQEMKPEPQTEPYGEPGHETDSRPAPVLFQETEAAAQSEIQPEPLPEPMPAAKPTPVSEPRRTAAGTPSSVAPPVTPAAPKKESVRPAAPAPPVTVVGAAQTGPPRSGSMVMVAIITLIILGLAGFGAFRYLQAPKPPVKESPPAMASTEGLHILNAAGAMQPNGDLLISGAVLNTTDREQTAWYVVVDVYDANGSVIHKIRLLNGKQLYTRSDYDILAKRGENIQELKARTLQDKGVVIPPKGNVAFEMHYLQPPAGIASFNAALQPFDPARLSNEMADEAK